MPVLFPRAALEWRYPTDICLTANPAAGAGVLTCTIRRGQHDGGDPRDLAIGRAKEILDFFVEDGYAFGEGVCKADRNESPEDHHPAPATIRGGGDWPCIAVGRHCHRTRAGTWCSLGSPEK